MSFIKDDIDLRLFVVKNNIKLHEIPIAVYCYSNTCDAGHQLAVELLKAGFSNVVDYKDGIMGWLNRS